MFFFAEYLYNYIALAASSVISEKIYKNGVRYERKAVQGYIKIYYCIWWTHVPVYPKPGTAFLEIFTNIPFFLASVIRTSAVRKLSTTDSILEIWMISYRKTLSVAC